MMTDSFSIKGTACSKLQRARLPLRNRRVLTPLRHSVLVSVLATYAAVSAAQISLNETRVQLRPSIKQAGTTGHVRNDSHIEISGAIRSSAVAKLVAILPEAQRAAKSFTHSGEPVVRVFLSSRGGEILAAIQLGRLVRAQGAEVWVDKGAECSSACILVLAAGVSRLAVPGAKLGIHRPYFQPDEFAGLSHVQAQERYSALSYGVREYLTQMGVAESLYDAMIRVPSQNMQYMSRDFAESSRLLGDDPAYQEWQRAKDRKALGEARQGMLDRYIECVNAGTADRECSRHVAGWEKPK